MSAAAMMRPTDWISVGVILGWATALTFSWVQAAIDRWIRRNDLRLTATLAKDLGFKGFEIVGVSALKGADRWLLMNPDTHEVLYDSKGDR